MLFRSAIIAGSTVAITLATNGTTTGRLFVPGGADDGSDLDGDLAGTWTLSGFSGAIIRLVLAKTD